MKIFGKEINLNGKSRTIAIVVAVVMVAVLATAVFALTPSTPSVQVKTVVLERNGNALASIMTDASKFVDPFKVAIPEAPDFPFGIEDSTGTVTLKGVNDSTGKEYTLSDVTKDSVKMSPKSESLKGTFPNSFSLYFVLLNETKITATITNEDTQAVLDRIDVTTTKDATDYEDYHGGVLDLKLSKYNAENIKIRFSVMHDVNIDVKNADIMLPSGYVAGVNKVDDGTNLSLDVKVPAGNVLSVQTTTAGASVSVGESVTKDELAGIWTYKVNANVTKDMDISFNMTRVPIAIKYTLEDDYSDNGHFTHNLPDSLKEPANKYYYNDQLNIVLNPENGYEYPVITVDSKTYKTTNGTYSIPLTNENTIVNISNAQPKEYTVSWPSEVDNVKSITVEGANNGKAKYNSKITIKVVPENGYNADSAPTVTAAGNYLTSTDGNATNGYTYTYIVKGDTSIAISGLKRNIYTITYEPVSDGHFTTDLTNKVKSVSHGDSFSFTVIPDAGYNPPVVKANTDTLSPVGTTYTINSVEEDTKITIDTAEAISYNASYVVNGDGVQKVEIDNEVFTVGGSVTITVTLNDGVAWNGTMTINSTSVKAATTDGKTYTYTYSATNPGDIVVTISGLSVKTYTVKMDNLVGVSNINAYTQSVKHGDNCTFILNLSKGYTVDTSLCAFVKGASEVVSNDGNGDTINFNPTTGVVTITCQNITGDGTVQFGTTNVDDNKNLIRPITVQALDAQHYRDTQAIGADTATVTLNPDTGYKINSAQYYNNLPDNYNSVAFMFPDSGIPLTMADVGNGSKLITIPFAYNDIYYTVNAEPITVNVTYNTNAINLGNAILPAVMSDTPVSCTISAPASSMVFAPVEFPFVTISAQQHLEAQFDGTLKLTLDPNAFAQGMYEDAANGSNHYFDKTVTVAGATQLTVIGDVVTIPAEFTHQDLNLTATANYTLSTALEPNKIPFITISNSGSSLSLEGTQVKFSWTATLTYDDGICESLKTALIKAQYTVDGYGFALFKTIDGRNTQRNNFASWIAIQTVDSNVQDNPSKEGFHLYRYYSNSNKQIGSNNGWFNYWTTADPNKMSGDGNLTGSPSRCGIFYFNVNIAGKTYAFIQDAQELTYSDVGVPSASLPAGIYPSMLG